jgi:OOP family OmpA-OmpF porin
MNLKKRMICKNIILACGFLSSALLYAQPVIVEGVVANQTSKQAILQKLYAVYGQDQVIDKIQIRPVATPQNWDDTVARVITTDLKKITAGKLTVKGTQVELTGKLMNPTEIQPVTSMFQSLVLPPYRVNTSFSINQSEQKIVDDALKDRIVEFESGSAILTATGTKILDEMAVALNKVRDKNVKIIGHTDSSGDAKKNVALSMARAEAVKMYLIQKEIIAGRLSTAGLGSVKPVADNASIEGRKKNRRIEFEVL